MLMTSFLNLPYQEAQDPPSIASLEPLQVGSYATICVGGGGGRCEAGGMLRYSSLRSISVEDTLRYAMKYC